MNFRTIGQALLICAVLAPSAALADDLHPPPWQRGLTNSTSQEWVFNTNSGGAPDGFINGLPGNVPWWNPNGTPTFSGLQGAANWSSSAFGRTGVWSLQPGAIMEFTIPNTPHSTTNHKEVWAQITWAVADPTGVVTLTPFGPPGSTVETIGVTPLPGGWFHSTFHYVLNFNPDHEYYDIINNSQTKLFIDQVVLDTICVPEPATLVGLGIGLLALARLRKSRK